MHRAVSNDHRERTLIAVTGADRSNRAIGFGAHGERANCQRPTPLLPESVPAEPPIEVAHTPRDLLPAPTVVDLVRRASAVGAVGPVAVVELEEVVAKAVDLRDARQEPHPRVSEHGLLEGAEHALDAAVGPSVAGLDEHVARAGLGEDPLDLGGAKHLGPVGQQPLRRAVLDDGTCMRATTRSRRRIRICRMVSRAAAKPSSLRATADLAGAEGGMPLDEVDGA